MTASSVFGSLMRSQSFDPHSMGLFHWPTTPTSGRTHAPAGIAIRPRRHSLDDGADQRRLAQGAARRPARHGDRRRRLAHRLYPDLSHPVRSARSGSALARASSGRSLSRRSDRGRVARPVRPRRGAAGRIAAAGAFIALGPVIATLLAIPILDEWPSAEDWTGIAVISVGVYLASGGPLPRRLLRRVA